MKPAELKIEDIVCFKGNRFPFGDMEVVSKDDKGVMCHRPYIDHDTKQARFEECWWALDSSFEFELISRWPEIQAVPR